MNRKSKSAVASILSILVTLSIVSPSLYPFLNLNRIIESSSWSKVIAIDTLGINQARSIEVNTLYQKYSNGTSIFNTTAETDVGLGVLKIKVVTVKGNSEEAPVKTMSPIQKEWFDGLLFALPPGNESFPVLYKHPDNIDTYFAGLWNLLWNKTGNERTWIHIPVTSVNQIEKDKEGEATFYVQVYGGILHVSEAAAAAALTAILLPKLTASVAAALSISTIAANMILPVVGAIIVAVIFVALEVYLTQTHQSIEQWVADYLRLYPGDGFMSWWRRIWGTDYYLSPTPCPDPWNNNLDKQFSLHLVNWAGWYESWGKEIEQGTFRYIKIEHDIVAKYGFRGGVWVGD